MNNEAQIKLVKLKKCSLCQVKKTLSMFNKDSSAKGGLKVACKICASAKYFVIHQEKLKEEYDLGCIDISICNCGSYFKNKIKNRYDQFSYRDKCKACSICINKNYFQKHIGTKKEIEIMTELIIQANKFILNIPIGSLTEREIDAHDSWLEKAKKIVEKK